MVPQDENDEKSYVRWQGYRIDQLGLCIALFLTFSVAALGFSVDLLVQPTYPITASAAKVLFSLSGICGLLSVACGSIAYLTRLADFRATAQVARHRENSQMKEQIRAWRKKYKLCGKWTWFLFASQLVLFALQAICLVASVVINFLGRLW
ncbi:MAG: hypothetical protein ACLP1Y_02940 [Candidatus Acidiferrales bacterium]